MTPRRIIRWRSFWLGILVFVFLWWAEPLWWPNSEKRIAVVEESEVVGVWRVDSEGNAAAFKDFSLTIHPDGRFESVGVPPGVLCNKSKEPAAMKGKWWLRYGQDNYLHLELSIAVPGINGGGVGGPLEWKGGRRLFSLGSHGGADFNIVREASP